MINLEKKIYNPNKDSQCFFRSTSSNNKALIKITEKCNMSCKHCFNDSDTVGNFMSINTFSDYIIPFLKCNNFDKITLTGGEPTLNKDIYDMISIAIENNLKVTLCTNGLNLNLKKLKNYDSNHLKINISLDGFTGKSYSNFRGVEKAVYTVLIEKIKVLSKLNLLKGILVTPNNYSTIDEYEDLVIFASGLNTKYVLFNKFAELGRGVDTQTTFNVTEEFLNDLRKRTTKYITDDFEVLYIRFPRIHEEQNICNPYKFYYIDINGDITICPYISFASDKLVLVSNVENYKNFQEDLGTFRRNNCLEDESDECLCDIALKNGGFYGKTNCN